MNHLVWAENSIDGGHPLPDRGSSKCHRLVFRPWSVLRQRPARWDVIGDAYEPLGSATGCISTPVIVTRGATWLIECSTGIVGRSSGPPMRPTYGRRSSATERSS
jgi:hypothetical protein